MPFRDKMKRAFGRPGDENSELTQVSSKASRKEKKLKQHHADNVYQPGEIMPKPKYRAAYNKDHQDKLSSFSFGEAWKRRKSDQSEYSPMGSRLPSVVGSLRRMSRAPGSSSRYVTDKVDESMAEENDAQNVGLSRPASRSEHLHPAPGDGQMADGLEFQHTATNGYLQSGEMGRPFTEEELTLAMTKTAIYS